MKTLHDLHQLEVALAVVGWITPMMLRQGFVGALRPDAMKLV